MDIQMQPTNENLRINIAVVQADMKTMKEDLQDIKVNLQKFSDDNKKIFNEIVKDRVKDIIEINKKIIDGDMGSIKAVDLLRTTHDLKISELERYKDDQIAINIYKKTFQTIFMGSFAALLLYLFENLANIIKYFIHS